MEKKITIISNYYYPEYGSAPRRISDLSMSLSDLGYDVEVICPMPNYPRGVVFQEYKKKIFLKEEWKGVKIRRYWISPSVSKNPILRAWNMFSFAFNLIFEIPNLTQRKPDFIIIQNSPLLVSFTSILISRLFLKTKAILNISDLWPLSAVELGVIKPNGFAHSIMQRIELFNYKKSDAIMGQSQEILDHVSVIVSKPSFLYRNLSYYNFLNPPLTHSTNNHALIYAGLLGVAQGIYEMIKTIDLSEVNTELHIYGDGSERKKIISYLKNNPNKKILFKGSLTHSELMKILPSYLAAIVPLKTRIKGAVPSKIYELAAAGVPIIFSGGGEGEQIIHDYNLGLVSKPNDYRALTDNIKKLVSLSAKDYLKIKESCLSVASNEFNYKMQTKKFNKFLTTI